MNRSLVIVTGASKGIGRSIVLALRRGHGAEVLAIARDRSGLQSLEEETRGDRGSLRTLVLDIAAGGAASTLSDAVGGDRVIGLVHNAGLLHKMAWGGHRRDDLEQCYRVNVIAPLEITQALTDRLDGEPPGHVVHVGSMGGFQDSVKFPELVAYSSSKAALACMAQCLAEEFKGRGIRSNCLALGAADTGMLRAAFPAYRAPVTAMEMGTFIADFTLNGHKLFNGKVLPVAVSTP